MEAAIAQSWLVTEEHPGSAAVPTTASKHPLKTRELRDDDDEVPTTKARDDEICNQPAQGSVEHVGQKTNSERIRT
jgi:hypothetical protein